VNSPELDWYQIVAVRIETNASKVPIRVANYGDGQGIGNVLASLERGDRNTYLVPARVRSATWDEQYVYTPFTLLFAKFHTHYQWVEAIYIYANVTAATLGLPDMLPEREIIYNETAVPAVNDVLPHLESMPQYVPLCADKRNLTPYDRIYGTSEHGTYFYRMNTACRPMHLEVGMTIVVVSVHSPNAPDVVDDIAAIHTGAMAYITTPGYSQNRMDSDRVGSQFGLPEADGSGLVSWLPDQVTPGPWSGWHDPRPRGVTLTGDPLDVPIY